MHGWLLTSMVAPTPVSALMHAGLVNAGGFLVARLAGLYGAAPEVLAVLFALGAVTAAVGAAAMLVQPDVKRSLGASTMAQMGFMMMQCGLGAFVAAIYHLVAHGLFKATLFLGAGSAVEGRPAVAPRTQAPGALGWGATAVLALSGTALFALVSGKGLGSGADAVLLAFVLVTAAHASLSSFRSMPTGRALPAAGVAVIGGALLYGVGLAAFGAFLGPVLPEAPQPLGALHAAVALGFVGAWFAGQILPGSLPPALYARLLAFGLKADCTDIAARRTPA
jgi:NAD(P)H-quinone oxidoreductase subunit 5